MAKFFNEQARYFQDKLGTRALADRIHDFIVHDKLTEEEVAFIESRDFFYISTVDGDGFPQCSYKGGARGFVKVVDDNTFTFPIYDGNGMYLTAGNIRENPQIGMLFIDHENPQKIRLNGTAEVIEDPAIVSKVHEAELLVSVTIREIFMNCNRYIHEVERTKDSPNGPIDGLQSPMADWKELEVMRDVLPEKDLRRLDEQEQE